MKIRIFLVLSLSIFFQTAYCQVEIKLSRKFVEENKNKITVMVNSYVYHSNNESRYVQQDFSNEKGLKPITRLSYKNILTLKCKDELTNNKILEEIPNAKFEPDAVDAAGEYKANGKTLNITGAWRLWPEAESDGNFELFPVTKMGGLDLSASFDKLKYYEFNSAGETIDRLSSLFSSFKYDDSLVIVNTNLSVIDLTGFELEAAGNPELRDDGVFINCNILDFDGRLLASNIRSAFIKNTEAETEAKKLKPGDTIKVIGIPRISLKFISDKIQQMQADNKSMQISLPYELVILALAE